MMKPVKRSSLKQYNNITSGDDEEDREGREYLERYQDNFIDNDNNGNDINNGDEQLYHRTRIPNGEGTNDDDDGGEDQMLLVELRSKIQFWNKFLVVGNSVLIFACMIILLLELNTNLLIDHEVGYDNGGNDSNNNSNDSNNNDNSVTDSFTIPNECLNYETFIKENNVESFFTCADYCSGGNNENNNNNNNILVNNTTNEQTHNLSSTNPSSTTTTICSDGNYSETTAAQCKQLCETVISSDLEYFRLYVALVCDDKKIQGSDEGLQLCVTECSPFDCCFSVDDDTSCLEEKEVLCEAFFDSCLKVHENAAMFGAGVGPQVVKEGD